MPPQTSTSDVLRERDAGLPLQKFYPNPLVQAIQQAGPQQGLPGSIWRAIQPRSIGETPMSLADLAVGMGQPGLRVVNPESALATFARVAFPKEYATIEADPRAWEFLIGSRRQPVGDINLYKKGAGGVTLPPEAGKAGVIGIRKDIWEQMLKQLPEGESTLAHELSHARLLASPDPRFRYTGLSAQAVPPARLEQMAKSAATHPEVTASGKPLRKFQEQYTAAGYSPSIASREALIEARGRIRTSAAVQSGDWAKAQKAVSDLLRDLASRSLPTR